MTQRLWEPFLESARRAVVLGQESALACGAESLGSEHIVCGLLEITESPLLPLFEQRGLSIDAYREKLPRGVRNQKPALDFSPEGRSLIDQAFTEARALNTNFIAPEHLVAALASQPQSLAAAIMTRLGFHLDDLATSMREQIKTLPPAEGATGLATMRRSYRAGTLDETAAGNDPLAILSQWIEAAREFGIADPNAMAVSTVNAAGVPSSRIVLLRDLSERGLVFYTSYLSRKGSEIAANPYAAALFYWGPLERQVRIEGAVEQVPDEESDVYFASRPRGHQLAAWASEQSEPVESRELLEQRIEDYTARFEGEDVPRPHSWGGYVIRPERIELWQGRENRLHDRLEFTKDGSDWKLRRLSP